jgi:hypothetical protein
LRDTSALLRDGHRHQSWAVVGFFNHAVPISPAGRSRPSGFA